VVEINGVAFHVGNRVPGFASGFYLLGNELRSVSGSSDGLTGTGFDIQSFAVVEISSTITFGGSTEPLGENRFPVDPRPHQHVRPRRPVFT